MKCVQCQSEDIVENIRTIDRGDYNAKHDLVLEVYEKPKALLFKGAQEGTVKANVCVDCGYVMFTVSKKDALKLKKYHNSSE